MRPNFFQRQHLKYNGVYKCKMLEAGDKFGKYCCDDKRFTLNRLFVLLCSITRSEVLGRQVSESNNSEQIIKWVYFHCVICPRRIIEMNPLNQAK